MEIAVACSYTQHRLSVALQKQQLVKTMQPSKFGLRRFRHTLKKGPQPTFSPPKETNLHKVKQYARQLIEHLTVALIAEEVLRYLH